MSADGIPSAAVPDALRIEHLDVTYRAGRRDKRVLKDLSFTIARGESYGLVGESGCGKSTVAFAAVRYLARNGRVSAGKILIDGRDLMALRTAELRRLRTQSVSMVYQDPGRALNPTLTIGRQMTEVFEAAEGLTAKSAALRAAEMLSKVRISNPDRVLVNYPHELSGGMQQRVVIAMALSTHPSLLILDEPTTGLDATVEADVLHLVAQLRREFGNSILFISHSLPVIARMCDRVGVLYAGELVEEGPAAQVFGDPRHPYTAALLRCVPKYGQRKTQGRLATIPGFLPAPGSDARRCVFVDRCGNATDRCRREAPPPVDLGGRMARCFYPERAAQLPRDAPDAARPANATRPANAARAPDATQAAQATQAPAALVNGRATAPILSARNLSKTYHIGGRPFSAVSEVALDLWPGETVGLVGESGSGKSSLAKLLLGLVAPDAGSRIELGGQNLAPLAGHRSAVQLQGLQIVFQNPGSALNRSQTVRRLLGRSLRLVGLSGAPREQRLRELAASVRLTEQHLGEKPGQLSGGLKQRVGIARAFAGHPRVVVCDEPTSALDVSVQSAILNLLVDLQIEKRVSYLFISHDLTVVHYLADHIIVLYLGRVLETGPADRVFSGPQHPYTEALLSANPADERPGAARIRLQGDLPSALAPPSGCVFHTRCPRKIGRICEDQEPPLLAEEPPLAHSPPTADEPSSADEPPPGNEPSSADESPPPGGAPAARGGAHWIRCHIPASELASLQLKRGATPRGTVGGSPTPPRQ